MSQADDPAAQRAFLARVLAELIAVRRARLLSMLVMAAAMLVAGLGAALQAQGDHIDAVLLFSAFSLIMIGIVCALGAIIAWTRINRDILDSVAASRPAKARAPRTRTAGLAVAIGFVVIGILVGALLWSQTPILAGAIVLACLLLACLGPIWAGSSPVPTTDWPSSSTAMTSCPPDSPTSPRSGCTKRWSPTLPSDHPLSVPAKPPVPAGGSVVPEGLWREL
ncbi:hypothetical protein [Brevibacterium spongiae]|uniref:Uncharacterized protein n=1 Tax=Brevibacterium spongiae TaxID=2909672 RepID=A0ABY5SPC1_9MICO|nr:hypothetical protein [Brevibacterium spongiae]UVI34564.1 hypothetical protein L1F31_10490 [Brevibacterium spongiae]